MGLILYPEVRITYSLQGLALQDIIVLKMFQYSVVGGDVQSISK